MTSKIRDKEGLPLTRALLCGRPQPGLLVSYPQEMLPPVCFHPLSVTIVPLSQSVSGNQTTSLAGPGKQTLGLLLLIESCTAAGEEVDSCRLTVVTEAPHPLHPVGGFLPQIA